MPDKTGEKQGMTKEPKPTTLPKPHTRTEDERTEEETAFLEDFNASKAAKMGFPLASLEVNAEEQTGTLKIESNDTELARALTLNALGTTDDRFADGLLFQILNACGQDGFRFVVPVISGLEPKDQMEAMLAAQMAAVHMATMKYAGRLTHASSYLESEMAEKSLNKLARTFTAQMEALKKYRSGGQQKMTVEHVHVHEGGQAIVGPVTQGGGGSKKKAKDQAHALEYAPGTPVPSEDPEGNVVPIPSGEGKEAV